MGEGNALSHGPRRSTTLNIHIPDEMEGQAESTPRPGIETLEIVSSLNDCFTLGSKVMWLRRSYGMSAERVPHEIRGFEKLRFFRTHLRRMIFDRPISGCITLYRVAA